MYTGGVLPRMPFRCCSSTVVRHLFFFFWKSLPVFPAWWWARESRIQAPPPGCTLPPSRGTGYPGEMHLCTPVPGVHAGSVGLRSQAIPTKTQRPAADKAAPGVVARPLSHRAPRLCVISRFFPAEPLFKPYMAGRRARKLPQGDQGTVAFDGGFC